MGEEVRGLRSSNIQLQNSHGNVEYSIGNGEAEALKCMTQGHEVRGQIAGGKRGTMQRKAEGGEIGITVIA